MACYFIANISIHDPDEYQKYIDSSEEIFAEYRGEYLAVDNQPSILEGKWDYTRCVLIRFETEQEFNKWYHSEKYQHILKHRLQAANCDSILVKSK